MDLEIIPLRQWRNVMSIRLTCPQCGMSSDVPDHFAGSTGKCNKCGTMVIVPSFASLDEMIPKEENNEDVYAIERVSPVEYTPAIVIPEDPLTVEIAAAEQRMSFIIDQIEEAKRIIQSWNDASVNLSQSAAEARAENQASGRGFMGNFLGSSYRGACRRAAAASNAAIARDVAERRAQITEGKREAREYLKSLQADLASEKEYLKQIKQEIKTRDKGKKSQNGHLDLLKKLKEAHEAGLLTYQEYEEKRRKLVSQI